MNAKTKVMLASRSKPALADLQAKLFRESRYELLTRYIDNGHADPLHGASALLEAYTSIYVTSGHHPGPIHVGLVRIGDRRAFAKLDHPPGEGEPDEAVLAGQKVKLLVKDDGDPSCESVSVFTSTSITPLFRWALFARLIVSPVRRISAP